jgi:hypothetical protein
MEQGLAQLRDFETGVNTNMHGSLQCRLWQLLCEKTECVMDDSWSVALQLVEREMASYKF